MVNGNNSYRVNLMVHRNVVRKFNINAPSEDEAREYGRRMIRKYKYDDTLIQVKVTKTD